MKQLSTGFLLTLILLDAIAIIIGMVAGPLSHTALSIGASLSAIIISAAIIIYGLVFWRKKRGQ